MAYEAQGYGSSWKKWLAIYVVIGAILYAVVYFVFLKDSGASSGGSGGGNGGTGNDGGGYLVLPMLWLSALPRKLRRRA